MSVWVINQKWRNKFVHEQKVKDWRVNIRLTTQQANYQAEEPLLSLSPDFTWRNVILTRWNRGVVWWRQHLVYHFFFTGGCAIFPNKAYGAHYLMLNLIILNTFRKLRFIQVEVERVYCHECSEHKVALIQYFSQGFNLLHTDSKINLPKSMSLFSRMT